MNSRSSFTVFLAALFSITAAAIGQQAGALKISSSALGNVFYTDQPVEFSLDTSADSIDWQVKNAWGAPVLNGSQKISSHPTKLLFPLKRPGYFELSISSKRGDQVVEKGSTRLAVITRFDLQTVKDSPFGVMTHFAQGWDTDVIPLIAAAGAKNVRDEAYWAHIETVKGQFDFTQFDDYMAALASNHIISLTPLTFGNPLYDRSDQGADWCIAPYSKIGFDGYSRYAQEVVNHFASQTQAVEIWNEYNGAFAPGPADGKPDAYAEMLKHVYPAIKTARQDVTVLGCSTSGIPMDWIETVFKNGGLDAMDGVSIHPYSYGRDPEWFDHAIPPLQDLIRKYNHGKDKPIWVTEDGWFTSPPSPSNRSNPLSELTKARYLVRAYTLLQSLGVSKTFWYLFRDYDQFGTMGLVGRDDDAAGPYAPHPAFVAYSVMTRQLSGARFVARDATDPSIRSYCFDQSGQNVRVLWSLQPQDVALATDQPLNITDMMGQSFQVQPVGGAVHLAISDAPIYVGGAVKSITAETAFALAMPAEAAVDEPLAMHLSVPANLNTGQLSILVDGAKISTQFQNGRADIKLPPSQEIGERWTSCEILSDGNTIFTGSALTQMRRPVVFDQFPHLIDSNTLEVRIYNMSQQNALTIRSLNWTLDGVSHQQPVRRDIAPGQADVEKISVPGIKPWTIYPAAISADFTSAAQLQWKGDVSYNPVVKRTIKVDGDLSKWADLPGIDLSVAPFTKLIEDNKGDADLSGHAWLSWDDQNLYFASSIRDDVFFQQNTGFNVWKGDNIQLGFSSGLPWPGAQAAAGSQELGLTLTPIGAQFYRFSGDAKKIGVLGNVPLVVKRTGDLTNYECAIPWTELDQATPSHGAFSFGIYVNDNDGKGRKGYKRWADIKDPAAYQPCYLQP